MALDGGLDTGLQRVTVSQLSEPREIYRSGAMTSKKPALDRSRLMAPQHIFEGVPDKSDALTAGPDPDELVQLSRLMPKSRNVLSVLEFSHDTQTKYLQVRAAAAPYTQVTKDRGWGTENRLRDYRSILLETGLTVLYGSFKLMDSAAVESIALEIAATNLNPATGRHEDIRLLSMRATRAQFDEIDFRKAELNRAFERLGGKLTGQDLQPVPAAIFDRSWLSETPPLRSGPDLPPAEFEHHIAALIRSMGVEAKTTTYSKDGGIDVVARDPRPLLGGTILIQAKQYVGTVPVAFVRELAGVVHEQRAMKGVLVTTGTFTGPASEFALSAGIELIDGQQLQALLQQYSSAGRPAD